jgi:hypothetical protein
MEKFIKGQKVVCIENAFEHWQALGFDVPVKDEIYTIREINYYDENHYKGYAIKLEEIINPVYRFPNMVDEVAFRIRYFLPLDEYLKTDAIDEIDISPLFEKTETEPQK